MDKTSKIDKLLKIKEFRRKKAESEVVSAKGTVQSARLAYSQAVETQNQVIDTAAQRRSKRIQKLLTDPENANLDSSRIVNVYQQTKLEIVKAVEETVDRKQQVSQATQFLSDKQQELARFLQKEERTRNLRDRLEVQIRSEKLRAE